MKRKTVKVWAASKAAKNANAATENATNEILRQTSLLEYAAYIDRPAAVGGATPVKSGTPAEYTIDMVWRMHFDKTILHQADENYVSWLCTDKVIWRFPKSLNNLFYALSRYTLITKNGICGCRTKHMTHSQIFGGRQYLASVFE